jgi:hypothetical protein
MTDLESRRQALRASSQRALLREMGRNRAAERVLKVRVTVKSAKGVPSELLRSQKRLEAAVARANVKSGAHGSSVRVAVR